VYVKAYRGFESHLLRDTEKPRIPGFFFFIHTRWELVMFYTYVLWSAVLRKRYIGSTRDLAHRLEQQNAGLSTFTKRGIPWIVVYSEDFPTRREAEQRERTLKSGHGRAWLDEKFPLYRSSARKRPDFSSKAL
jgi:putative endonuclease